MDVSRIQLFIILVYSGSIICNFEMLKAALQNSIFNQWSFKSNFSNFETLKADRRSIKLGIYLDGLSTIQAIERIVQKVITGQNVTMVVFGGSCSQGADLGCQSMTCTYHYAFYAWWNSVIAPYTGSYLKRQVIAVGGVGSTYFGHCWREYLVANQCIDLIFWEFFINDPDSQEYGKGLEKFIRTIFLYPSKPGLVFVQFLSRSAFPNKLGQFVSCKKHSSKLDTLNKLSRHYGFTTANLHTSLCSYMLNTRQEVRVSEMFSNLHPSHLAHAQMAYILIEYIRGKIYLEINKSWLGNYQFPQHDQISNIPLSIYHPFDVQSICWSAVRSDERSILPHDLYRLKISYNFGFTVLPTPKWDPSIAVRCDVRGGYVTQYAGKYLSILFAIAEARIKNIYVAISHVETGGNTLFILSNTKGLQIQRTINCSRKIHQAMDITYLGTFPPGHIELTIQTVSGGCQISAIIIE